jgi:hypothetical protein
MNRYTYCSRRATIEEIEIKDLFGVLGGDYTDVAAGG